MNEVAKFAELSWFHPIAKQSKLAEQWRDAHGVGKLKRADEHLLVIRSLTRSAGAGRRQARDEKWNLGSVKAVLNRVRDFENEYGNRHISCQTEAHHESSVERTQAYTTLHKMCLGYRSTLPSTI